MLLKRINNAKKHIEHLQTFIPQSRAHEEAIEKHSKLAASLERFIVYCGDNWREELVKMDPKSKTDELEPKIEERLLKNILMKHPPAPVEEKGKKEKEHLKNPKAGLIESNFDSHLIKALAEAPYWSKVANSGIVTVPHVITKFALKRE